MRVTDVRRQDDERRRRAARLTADLSRRGDADDKITLPVQFEIEGARSIVPVELSSRA